jgi:hypothetical protein
MEINMKVFVKKYWKIVVLVVASLVIGWAYGATMAKAAGVPVLEVGISGESDFTDLKVTSTSEMQLYSFGEVDFGLGVVDYSVSTGLEGGELTKRLDGKVGLYGRVYGNSSIEVLAGIDQPLLVDGGVAAFDNTRVWKLRVRKPY